MNATDSDRATTDRAKSAIRFDRVAHSTGGQLVGNAMVGLAWALYGRPDDRPAIVADTGEPVSDQLFEVHLDFDHPDRSFVVRRQDPEPSP